MGGGKNIFFMSVRISRFSGMYMQKTNKTERETARKDRLMKHLKLILPAAAALLLLAGCAARNPEVSEDPVSPDATQAAEPVTESPVLTQAPEHSQEPLFTEAPESTSAPEPTEVPQPTDPGPEVSFYSARFEKDFRDQTGKTDRPIYEADVLNTKSLEFTDRRLYELRDLAMFKNLESLTLQNTDVDDLSVLSEMQSLKKLVLTGNDYLRDLSPIASLTGLREVNLGGQYTPVEDLTLFSGMTELESLRVWPLVSTDLSPIAGLTHLKSLIIANRGMSDGIADISVLSGLKELELINLGGTFSDISALAELKNMKDMVIYCSVSDITPLSGLTKITRLSIDSDYLTDISALAGMTELEKIYLGCPVKDISVFAGFTKLTEIHMPNCMVEDITPIAGLTKLTWVEMPHNRITDISALSGLNELQDLRMSGNYITDVTPLYGLSRLKFLSLSGEYIPSDQKAELRRMLPNCGIYIGDDGDI